MASGRGFDEYGKESHRMTEIYYDKDADLSLLKGKKGASSTLSELIADSAV